MRKIIKIKQWFIILLIFFTWSCSPEKKKELPNELQELKNLTVYSTDTKSDITISFEKKAIYKNSKNVLIGKMGDFTIDSLGRVFIADVQNHKINVYQPDGRFLGQLGREGRGPGEFNYIKKLHISNDFLYVFDANFGLQKVIMFELDTLERKQTILLAGNRSDYKSLAKAYPGVHEIYVRNDNTLLAEFISHSFYPTQKWQNVEMKSQFFLLNSTGEIASNKLIEFKDELRTFHLGLLPIKPFFGESFTFLLSNNNIYRAGPEYFLIKEYSPEGNYLQAFYYPIKKVSLTKESAVEAKVNDYYIQNMKLMDLPLNWPVLTDIKIDSQGRFWVATTVEDMKVFEWWVLKKSGELITKFKWPRNRSIEKVKNGYIYTHETDNKRGLDNIIKYKFNI